MSAPTPPPRRGSSLLGVRNGLDSLPNKWAEINGIRIGYVDAGPTLLPKDVLLLLHGWIDFCYSWRHQVPFFAARDYRVIAPNLRGYNPGDPNPPAADHATRAAHYTHALAVDDLVKLLDREGIESVTAVGLGQELGGTIATRLALLHPSRVHRLVLLSQPYKPPSDFFIPAALEARAVPITAYRTFMASPEAEQQLNENAEALIRVVLRRGSETPGMLKAMAGLRPGVRFAEMARAAGPSTLLTEEEIAAYASHFLSLGGFGGPLQWVRGASPFPCPRREIPAPTLFVAGEHGPFSVPAYRADMRALVPDLTEVDIEDAGAYLHVEMPDAVNRTILTWLESRR